METLHKTPTDLEQLSFISNNDELSHLNQLIGYRGDHDYLDAIESGAIHKTGSSMDAFDLFNDSKTPFYDLAEAVQLQRDITGLNDYLCGIVFTTATHDLFIDLRFISAMIDEYSDEIKLIELANLAVGCCTCESFYKNYTNSDVEKSYISYTKRKF
ncbi:hypothetical protein THF1C08_50054 [Vibrio jasicida]|uniref:Uncharacterized protein n=1 Tax=Vibrio jasicida TaxID=766224 RepID=A0AAU9QTV7_9VIBR|nr:hypothetical protein THF1C08_50054 [Vibrio jasicida]CAH1601881.1 hypothetical protein THF1A12_50295 [Vibrio jasicida]